MQGTSRLSDNHADVLLRRVQSNRQLMLDTRYRLSSARREAREYRNRSKDLRGEVRQKLDSLAEGIVTARQWRPAQAGRLGAVLPRYHPEAPDPLDIVRQKLHEEYAATGDPALRDELMSSYDGFARSLALKFRHRESVDDLVQVARIGLLHAIDRFDPALGRPFPLFARITITGELKRHIRDRTWAMRVPRSLQEDYLDVMRAVDELTSERSDSPSLEAVAERCEMSVDRVIEAMELRLSQRAMSIDTPPAAGFDEPVPELGQEDIGFRQLENREMLVNLLSRLSERDRRILELRFIHELTQAEIADRVGVSQMCVSRVLARALGRLRLWARVAVA